MAEEVTENWEAKLFPLILALGVLLRFSNLGQSQLWVDEIIQLQTFSHASFRENLAHVTRIVAATPLDFIVQHLFVSIFGESEFGARFHAALFGSLSLPMLYLIGKRFFSTQVALLGMLLFALYPLHHQYSQEGPELCAFLLSILVLLLRNCQGSGEQKARLVDLVYCRGHSPFVYQLLWGCPVGVAGCLPVLPQIRTNQAFLEVFHSALHGTGFFCYSCCVEAPLQSPFSPGCLQHLTEQSGTLQTFSQSRGFGCAS